jgi:hypothetical protein
MARIHGVDRRRLGLFARLFTRFIYFMTKRMIGRVPVPLQLAAHRPQVLVGVGMMENGQARSRALAAPLKALAGLRASTRVGCVF